MVTRMNFIKRSAQWSRAPTEWSRRGCCLGSPTCDCVWVSCLLRLFLWRERRHASRDTPVQGIVAGGVSFVVVLAMGLPPHPLRGGVRSSCAFHGPGWAPAGGIGAPFHHVADHTFVWLILCTGTVRCCGFVSISDAKDKSVFSHILCLACLQPRVIR